MNSACRSTKRAATETRDRDQKQRAMNSIARHYGQQSGENRREREYPEEKCFPTGEDHRFYVSLLVTINTDAIDRLLGVLHSLSSLLEHFTVPHEAGSRIRSQLKVLC